MVTKTLKDSYGLFQLGSASSTKVITEIWEHGSVATIIINTVGSADGTETRDTVAR